MTTENNNIPVLEQQFAELLSMINYHRSRASQAVNEQQLLTAWNVGCCLPNYFVQTVSAQIDNADNLIKSEVSEIVQLPTAQFVQSKTGQMIETEIYSKVTML